MEEPEEEDAAEAPALGDGDLEKMIEEIGIENVMALLQSEEGLGSEILAEIANNPDVAEFLKEAQGDAEVVTAETENLIAATEVVPAPPSSSKTEFMPDPVSLPDESKSDMPGEVAGNIEGITVCHDGGGGDLRPKVKESFEDSLSINPEPGVPKSNLALIEVKIGNGSSPQKLSDSIPRKEETMVPVLPESHEGHFEPHHSHHHRQKDKKKEKERDKDKEDRKKRHKQEKQKSNSSRPARHPEFSKYKKLHRLLDTSVTLVKLDTIVPLSRHMHIKRRKLNQIEDVDLAQQTKINNKLGRIRLVPRPRPVYEPYKPDSLQKKNEKHGEVRRRKVWIASSSESDSDTQKKNKPSTSAKKLDKDHRKTSKLQPHGEFSPSGTRILPFEKRANQNKAQTGVVPIKRPKMQEPEIKKEPKKEKSRFRSMGSKESEQKVQDLIARAIEQSKAQQIQEQFRIPKSKPAATSRELEVDRDRVTTSTPLSRIREERTSIYPRENRRKINDPAQLAPNSYGRFKYEQQYGRNVEPSTRCMNGGVDLLEAEREKEAKQIQKRLELRRGDADFDYEDDDNPVDMHDVESDDEEDEPALTSSPTHDVTAGPVAIAVCKMLSRSHPHIEYPGSEASHLWNLKQRVAEEPSLAEATVKKCAWWFQGINTTIGTPILTIPTNPEIEDSDIIPEDGNSSEVSSFGNVSNPGDRCQINEVSSYSDQEKLNDPDVLDEFCGASTLFAEYRISSDDKFQAVFSCKKGTKYERESLQVTCNICHEEVNGKRNLGKHIRSEIHRSNFRKISLSIMPKSSSHRRPSEEVVERVSRDGTMGKSSSSKEKEKEHGKNKARNGERGSSSKTSHEIRKEEKAARVSRTGSGEGSHRASMSSRLRKSRSRSRSPYRLTRRHGSPRSRKRSRSRSSQSSRRQRSSRRRSTSAEKVAKFLEKTRRSRSRSHGRVSSRSGSPLVRLRKSRKHEPIFKDKLQLQAAGKWTPALEHNWNEMEREEKLLEAEIRELRTLLCDRPEDHPLYEREWTTYWEKTYHEVELAGHNPDTYDYIPGWKNQWAKRAEELQSEAHYNKLGAIRAKYGMEPRTLQRLLLDIPAAPLSQPIQQQQVVLINNTLPIVPPGTEMYTPFEDDLTARPMSLSGSSRSNDEPRTLAIPVPTPEPSKEERIVTADSVQKVWARLIGQPPAPPKSDRSGSIGESLDVEMELVEVLRLMNGLEDQLSILAPQVNDYLKRAETLEKIEVRKSYNLLEDKDFVALLFLCRDKFIGLIKANILTKEILKRVNKTVYGLNIVLDLEPCHRLKPKSFQPVVEADTAAATLEEAFPDFALLRRPPRSHVSDVVLPALESKEPPELDLSERMWGVYERIQRGMRRVPDEKKLEIAALIAESIAAAEWLTIDDTELVQYVHDCLKPALVDVPNNYGPRESLNFVSAGHPMSPRFPSRSPRWRSPPSYDRRPQSSPGGRPRFGQSPVSMYHVPEPEPGHSSRHYGETDVENSPPPWIPKLEPKSETPTTSTIPTPKQVIGIAQAAWNTDEASSISSGSIAGSGAEVKRGSRSTLSNGSNRSRLKEVQPQTNIAQHQGGHAEALDSAPESGELLSDDEALTTQQIFHKTHGT